tara:strand:- start:1126 stop:1281 length:156 start_codon:yes stop_codon:yes gene_type:complete
MKKINIPEYLVKILTDNPNISSGRKNYLEQHIRIVNQIKLIKNYFSKGKKN